jgi:formate hydrogenlyase transcriptional activator
MGISVATLKDIRSDLYYRLNVFPIEIPPLRERSEDIPLLVRHFVRHFAHRMSKTIEMIPAEAMDALTRYAWPGNTRELQNLIERTVILSTGTVLPVPVRDLSIRTIPAQDSRKHRTPGRSGTHILATVKETKWVLSGPKGAATRLGVTARLSSSA